MKRFQMSKFLETWLGGFNEHFLGSLNLQSELEHEPSQPKRFLGKAESPNRGMNQASKGDLMDQLGGFSGPAGGI